MPAALSLADVIDKNKVASENAWLILLDIEVRDDFDQLVETVHIVKNNENIVYHGETYIASEFTFESGNKANEEPQVNVSIEDVTGAIREKMENYNGGIGFAVTVTVVNSGNLEADPELQETFEVTTASAPDTNVSWTLGGENPLKFDFPYRKQYIDRCDWLYKGRRCKYSGPLPTCSYTKDGSNGCKAHGNLKNFGGFPGLQNRQ